MKNYYAIIALSFGTGKSNKYLAEIVEGISKEFPEAKLILQQEIAWEFIDLSPESYDKFFEITHHRQEGKYLDTLEVLSQAKHILQWHCSDKSNEWKNIILIAHPDHFPRARLVAKTLGFNPPAMGVVPYFEIPYDKNSAQFWTRGRIRFLIWSGLAYLWLIINPGRKK